MKRFWTQDEDDILKKDYANTLNTELVVTLNRPIGSIYCRAQFLGLKKSKEFLHTNGCYFKKGDNTGVAYRFKKGDVPFNKGQKMPDEVKAKVLNTTFKKGNKPHNTYSGNGVIVTRVDKTKRPYQYIKIGDSNWQLLHRVLWKQHHGLIPKGMIIAFKDGNSMNCIIENLEMITMAENAIRNKSKFEQYPTELKQVIRIKNKITKKINKIKHEQLDHRN